MLIRLLGRLRPSTLVALAALPLVVWLMVAAEPYKRSLKAIVGVEPGAGQLFAGFLILVAFGASGGWAAFNLWRLVARRREGRQEKGNGLPRHARVALGVHVVALAVILFLPATVRPYIHSMVAHAVDPFGSDWIVQTVRPRQLVPGIAAALDRIVAWAGYLHAGLLAGMLAAGMLAPGMLATGGPGRRTGVAGAGLLQTGIVLAGLIPSGLLVHVLFFGHGGFAPGLLVTLRAAIFAYAGAAVLGLGLAGLLGLKPGHRTCRTYALASVALLAGAVLCFVQPRQSFVLAGVLTDARIAIVKGTPQGLTDRIRYGAFDAVPAPAGTTLRIRSVATAAQALALMADTDSVSAALLPADTPGLAGLPILLETGVLPSHYRLPGLWLAVFGGLLGILTFGAWLHGQHPLAAGAGFFIDTVRGIPMLVIILYIGLPLSGAVKAATGGVIDLANMTRGIIAIAIGYSAYMAEIFRAGIEAIPRGQIEAAKAVGLHRWHVARLVILPQALRIVIPPLGNEFIAMLKDTSLLSILSVRDVTQRMREFQAASFLPFAPFNTAAILYVFLTLACASLLKWTERRHDRRFRERAPGKG